MAYEKSEITADPVSPQIQFKEEKVIDPYRSRANPQATGAAEIGQKNTSGNEEKPPTDASVTLSPAAAALARKEQKTRQKELDLKAKEELLEKERLEFGKLRELRDKLSKKDYSGIEDLVKYDEYTNYLIEKEQGQDPTQTKLTKLESDFEAMKNTQKSEVDKLFQAQVAERRRVVKELVEKSPDFPGVKKLKLEEHVVQHILDTWEHEGIDLSPEEAAKEVEEVLKEKAKEWKDLYEEKKEEKKPLPPLKTLKTLTNNLTSPEIKKPVKSFYGMSDSERWAEARRRAEEKLKGK
jgi:hypothetical protein